MNDDVQQFLMKAARREFPNEACGLIFGDDDVVQIRNVAKSKDHFFIMDYAQLREVVEGRGRLPSAYWHTHPQGDITPSGADRKHHMPGYRMVIATASEVMDYGYP